MTDNDGERRSCGRIREHPVTHFYVTRLRAYSRSQVSQRSTSSAKANPMETPTLEWKTRCTVVPCPGVNHQVRRQSDRVPHNGFVCAESTRVPVSDEGHRASHGRRDTECRKL